MDLQSLPDINRKDGTTLINRLICVHSTGYIRIHHEGVTCVYATEAHFSTTLDVHVRTSLGERFTVAVLLQEPKRCCGVNRLQRSTWNRNDYCY